MLALQPTAVMDLWALIRLCCLLRRVCHAGLCILQGCVLRGGSRRREENQEAGGHKVYPEESTGREREQHRERDRCAAQVSDY